MGGYPQGAEKRRATVIGNQDGGSCVSMGMNGNWPNLHEVIRFSFLSDLYAPLTLL
jgi:hypothetical protein